MRNGRLVIGVVGITRNISKLPSAATIESLALEVGKVITEREQILLTGGEPSSGTPKAVRPVKIAAIDGAKSVPGPKSAVRLISVLRGSKFAARYPHPPPPNLRHLIVDTALNDERNLITGYVPDVMIVIHGGAGTLSEIAFANAVGTPLVFLQADAVDTVDVLKRAMDDSKFHEILLDTYKVFPIFNIGTLVARVYELIHSSSLNIVDSAQDAVDMAIAMAHQRIMYSLNGLPYHSSLVGHLLDYESHLDSLAA
jgi:predicted Rossmann-fold nucleotide-binding protein